MSKEHIVTIPEVYLLILAVNGNMGSGDVPDFMRQWAKKEVDRLGLERQYRNLQKEHIDELRSRLRKTLGNEMTNKLENSLSEVTAKIMGAL